MVLIGSRGFSTFDLEAAGFAGSEPGSRIESNMHYVAGPAAWRALPGIWLKKDN
jgi:hypothetical protein